MHKGNFTLPRVLRWVVWFSAVFTMASMVVGAFGLELAGVGELLGVHLGLDVANQYATYPWYWRLLILAPPDLAMAYALARLAALLGCAARGQVFSAPASGHLRIFGLWLLIATLAGVLLPFPLKFLYLLVHSPETFTVTFGFDSESIWKLFFSALVMLLARVLSDGYKLAEENRQFI